MSRQDRHPHRGGDRVRRSARTLRAHVGACGGGSGGAGLVCRLSGCECHGAIDASGCIGRVSARGRGIHPLLLRTQVERSLLRTGRRDLGDGVHRRWCSAMQRHPTRPNSGARSPRSQRPADARWSSATRNRRCPRRMSTPSGFRMVWSRPSSSPSGSRYALTPPRRSSTSRGRMWASGSSRATTRARSRRSRERWEWTSRRASTHVAFPMMTPNSQTCSKPTWFSDASHPSRRSVWSRPCRVAGTPWR